MTKTKSKILAVGAACALFLASIVAPMSFKSAVAVTPSVTKNETPEIITSDEITTTITVPVIDEETGEAKIDETGKPVVEEKSVPAFNIFDGAGQVINKLPAEDAEGNATLILTSANEIEEKKAAAEADNDIGYVKQLESFQTLVDTFIPEPQEGQTEEDKKSAAQLILDNSNITIGQLQNGLVGAQEAKEFSADATDLQLVYCYDIYYKEVGEVSPETPGYIGPSYYEVTMDLENLTSDVFTIVQYSATANDGNGAWTVVPASDIRKADANPDVETANVYTSEGGVVASAAESSKKYVIRLPEFRPVAVLEVPSSALTEESKAKKDSQVATVTVPDAAARLLFPWVIAVYVADVIIIIVAIKKLKQA